MHYKSVDFAEFSQSCILFLLNFAHTKFCDFCVLEKKTQKIRTCEKKESVKIKLAKFNTAIHCVHNKLYQGS